MRYLLLLLLCSLILFSWCQKNTSYPHSSNFTGTFSQMSAVGYSDKTKEDCIQEWGEYFYELCTIDNDAEEYISIVLNTGWMYYMSTATVGHNRSGCFFEGEAEQISPTQLQSIVKTPDREGNEDAETCIVTVTVSGDNASLDSSDGSSCWSFCGNHGSLELYDVPRE